MLGEPTPPDLCEYCHERAPRLRVKHAETCRHWRCLECARELMTKVAITVTGWALPTRSHAVEPGRVVEMHAADMLKNGIEGISDGEADAAGRALRGPS